MIKEMEIFRSQNVRAKTLKPQKIAFSIALKIRYCWKESKIINNANCYSTLLSYVVSLAFNPESVQNVFFL